MATPELSAPAPAWARGFPLEELRDLAAVYRECDKPYVLGAFSAVKENTLAEWLEDAELVAFGHERGSVDAVVRVFIPRVRVPVRDFTGATRAYIEPGAAVLYRPAATTRAGWDDLLELGQGDSPMLAGRQVWLEGWVENADVRGLAHYLVRQQVAVKIKASSELVGVWAPPEVHTLAPLEAADAVTLGRIRNLGFLDEQVAAAAREVEGMAGWAQHYSSYNARHAWTALALHGYVDPAQGPNAEQIVKPAEMSKAWKAEHPGSEAWPLAWTPLAQRLPAVTKLLAEVAHGLSTRFQRVRLMRLEPGGGELTRHSDITDPEAGTADGKLARLHLPLVTNPDVRFRQWNLRGRQVEAVMRPGELWYLDTRKPHRAGNYGTTPRIHLVADAYVGPALRQAIAASAEAAEVEG